MAHTQGPWRIGEPRDGFIGNVLADNPRRLLAQVTVQDGEQTLANAMLIAAAPDMLDALEAVIDDLEGYIDEAVDHFASDEWIDGARARLRMAQMAIAKAKGEA
jgi:hypothetical protein